MTNLQGASPVGRDDEGRSYEARTIGRGEPVSNVGILRSPRRGEELSDEWMVTE